MKIEPLDRRAEINILESVVIGEVALSRL